MAEPAPPKPKRWWQQVHVGLRELALIAGLIASLISIYLFFAAKPAAEPQLPGSTSASSTSSPPEFAGELSTHSGAANFVAFAQANDGNTVHVDLSCIDDFATATCFVEPLDEMILVWVFTNERCFTDDSGNADLESCRGANVFWIRDRTNTKISASNGPSGAGSVEIKGEARLADLGFGGSIFPVSIRSWDVTPIPL